MIDYRPEPPSPADFIRLFRASGWSEADEIPEERLAAAPLGAWCGVTARLGGRVVGMGLVLSDGALHALIVDVIVAPELRGTGIGTEVVRRLVARCREAGIPSIQLFCARGKRPFYERLGFVARPDDGPGMELA